MRGRCIQEIAGSGRLIMDGYQGDRLWLRDTLIRRLAADFHRPQSGLTSQPGLGGAVAQAIDHYRLLTSTFEKESDGRDLVLSFNELTYKKRL